MGRFTDLFSQSEQPVVIEEVVQVEEVVEEHKDDAVETVIKKPTSTYSKRTKK
jgi:hypothetical protein